MPKKAYLRLYHYFQSICSLFGQHFGIRLLSKKRKKLITWFETTLKSQNIPLVGSALVVGSAVWSSAMTSSLSSSSLSIGFLGTPSSMFYTPDEWSHRVLPCPHLSGRQKISTMTLLVAVRRTWDKLSRSQSPMTKVTLIVAYWCLNTNQNMHCLTSDNFQNRFSFHTLGVQLHLFHESITQLKTIVNIESCWGNFEIK